VERLLFSIMSQVHQTSVILASLSAHLDLSHSVSHVMLVQILGIAKLQLGYYGECHLSVNSECGISIGQTRVT
jgi:hypothetical protein